MAFSPDSKQLLYTYGSNDEPPVGAADPRHGRRPRALQLHGPRKRRDLRRVVCATGKQVATGDSVSGIRMWDPATGKTVRRLEGLGKAVFAAGWSPDGQAVAWGNSTGQRVVDIGPPLERTFCFNNLDFGPPPDNDSSVPGPGWEA